MLLSPFMLMSSLIRAAILRGAEGYYGKNYEKGP